MRDRLIGLIQKAYDGRMKISSVSMANFLLSEGVIVPPCKVGDMVYIPNSIDKKVHKYRVYEINIGAGNNNIVVLDKYIGDYILPRNISIYFNRFGKTAFLTKEEAEKALAERSENGK